MPFAQVAFAGRAQHGYMIAIQQVSCRFDNIIGGHAGFRQDCLEVLPDLLGLRFDAFGRRTVGCGAHLT